MRKCSIVKHNISLLILQVFGSMYRKSQVNHNLECKLPEMVYLGYNVTTLRSFIVSFIY